MLDPYLVRAKWNFLATIHPLFLYAQSLPTVEGAGEVQYSNASAPNIDRLKNEITMLRSDFKLNIIKQQQVDVEQLDTEDSTFKWLQRDLQLLLEELENMVDPNVVGNQKPECADETDPLSCFRRLVALRNILQQQECPESEWTHDIEEQLIPGIKSDISAFNQMTFNPANTRSQPNSGARYSLTLVAQAASHIQFPQDLYNIESCRRVINRFGMVLDSLLEDSAGLWAMEAQTLNFTSQDVKIIQNAYNFASNCTSLFGQMASGTNCGTIHHARLQLSGFKTDELRMNINTCQGTGWVPVSFTHSLQEPASKLFNMGHICSQPPYPSVESEPLHVAFNPGGMWEYPMEQRVGLDYRKTSGRNQDTVLARLLTHQDHLTPKYRKLTGVLLATSLFQLNESPWLEHHFSPDTIYVPSPARSDRGLQQWCPRVRCSLLPKTDAKKDSVVQSDNIAAFGVLVLELEADRQALWTEEDTYWLSGERSNQVRLARILKSWEDLISDGYRGVAKACLEFDSLVENTSHMEIGHDKKGIAVIYKCIVEPLFFQMMKSYGKLGPLFKDMFGPGRGLGPAMNLSAYSTAKRILFDDDESLPKPDDQVTAAKFLKELKPFFDMIRSLHLNQSISLTMPLRQDRIRIAVLDSGVDETDTKIRSAIKFGRINVGGSKSFVGRSDQWQDSHGHGTHIVRILLETAPRAEIFVGKICTGKMINDEFMPGIAKAIDWAVHECGADIISMSFGFDDENELIDVAVDNAVDAGKLVFAAASNNGGITGRARPARHEGVICVHASDGKGNKGGMNPTPLANSDNFSTLGVAVPSQWKGEQVWKSGTSFAAPMAASFAADVLEFANHRCVNLKSRKQKLLGQKRGMQAIFRRMAEHRDGYDFIHPGRLWEDWQNPIGKSDVAARTIEDIMQSL